MSGGNGEEERGVDGDGKGERLGGKGIKRRRREREKGTFGP